MSRINIIAAVLVLACAWRVDAQTTVTVPGQAVQIAPSSVTVPQDPAIPALAARVTAAEAAIKALQASTPTTPPVVTPPVVTPPVVEPPATGSRDVLRQPFASTSIWNVPIGSGARYVAAGLSSTFPTADASIPYPDENVIVLRPGAPLVDVREGPWSGDRCSPTSAKVFARVPLPSDLIVPNGNGNLAGAVLSSDRRTVVNVQPLTRCGAGGAATSIVRWPDSDLYGDGIDGAHGGSGMSSLGGTLRVGELRKGATTGPRHALQLIVWMQEGYRCTTYAQCYRWPARAADGYAVGRYGTAKAGPAAMKMGALLALPASVDIAALGLETEPGRLIAWTLQNYGGYIVDDAWGGQFGIGTERGPDGVFVQQFQADFGFSFHQRTNATGAGAAWMRDMQRLVRALHVVDNNSATSIGGGGTPRQPLAPEVRP